MFREVEMVEITEVLRLWLAAVPKKRIAAQLGLDPKTVRHYVRVATATGLTVGTALTDEMTRDVLLALQPGGGRPRGDSWALCQAQRAVIERGLQHGLRLTKIRRLLVRQGVAIPYPTLHRFAVLELRFGQSAATVPVVDGEPGQELQVDTGWVGWLTPSTGRRRRFRAWIFTAVRSRYRFVYPAFEETTARAIEACEAAWAFFGGVFAVLIPDNTKAIITTADPLEPRVTPTFREYAQARGFHIDAARVRHPRDKGRVERAVPTVRDDCFAGETLTSIDDARTLAVRWCREEYGWRRHSRTQRQPRAHFEAEEQSVLRPGPLLAYDVPRWSTPKVARDQCAQVAKAIYSLPTSYVGRSLTARADQQTVRFYDRHTLVKTHPRQPPGGRAIDPADYPTERSVYALRDVATLQRQAASHGAAIGQWAAAVLDSPLPWTRMRRVYALLGLVRRYGAGRVNDACTIALAAEMLDVYRLRRMLELGQTAPPAPTSARVVPLARFLRPATQYALPLRERPSTGDPDDPGCD
jgi:transposase